MFVFLTGEFLFKLLPLFLFSLFFSFCCNNGKLKKNTSTDKLKSSKSKAQQKSFPIAGIYCKSTTSPITTLSTYRPSQGTQMTTIQGNLPMKNGLKVIDAEKGGEKPVKEKEKNAGKQEIEKQKKSEVPAKTANCPPTDAADAKKSECQNSTTTTKYIIKHPSDFLPLDRTVYKNIYNPAVHHRSVKDATDGLIVDPKLTKYLGNVDLAVEREKNQRFLKFQEELFKEPVEASTTNEQKNQKVRICEDKCVLFETNEVPTVDDDNEEEEKDDGIL